MDAAMMLDIACAVQAPLVQQLDLDALAHLGMPNHGIRRLDDLPCLLHTCRKLPAQTS